MTALDFVGFNISHCRFHLKLLEDLELPPFKGFALRGVFGTALRELSCSTGMSSCIPCQRRGYCPYVYLFETIPDETITKPGKYSSFPRPYVIVPPLEAKQNYKKGENLTFEILLFGHGTDYLPHVISAFELIGNRGFQRRGKVSRFTLDAVECMDGVGGTTPIYQNGYLKEGPIRLAVDKLCKSPHTNCSVIRLDFSTPLRIELMGKPMRETPSFGMLLENLHRRVALINRMHCGSVVEYEPLSSQADVSVVVSTLAWHELERYSNRQNARINQSGLLGSVTYRGNFDPDILKLLKLGEYTGVGKSATQGLGRYRLAFF